MPNGLDGPDHISFRAVLDPFLSPAALARYRADFELIATELVASLPQGLGGGRTGGGRHLRGSRAERLARLGPGTEGPRLLDWIENNHAATRSARWSAPRRWPSNSTTLSGRSWRSDETSPRQPTSPVNCCGWKCTGRLTRDETMSVLRNCTGDDLGSIALSVGELVHQLASRPEPQSRLRRGVPDAEMDLVVDQVLQIDDPFVSNRRLTTGPVNLGGVRLPEVRGSSCTGLLQTATKPRSANRMVSIQPATHTTTWSTASVGTRARAGCWPPSNCASRFGRC